jgi:aerotaxis receptor
MVEELAATAKAIEGQVDGVRNTMRLFRLSPGDSTLSCIDAVALRQQYKQ